MPFHAPVPPPPADKEDLENANFLAAAIKKARRFHKAIKVNNWAEELRRLRVHDLAGDGSRLRRVLEWYGPRAGEPFLPVAFSAAGFRAKFLSIEAARDRYVTATGDGLQISDDARRLVEEQGAGTEIAALLPAVAHASLETLRRFDCRLRDFVNDDIEDPSGTAVARFARVVLEQYWPGPFQAAREYITALVAGGPARVRYGALVDIRQYLAGVGYAEHYTCDPARWVGLCDALEDTQDTL